MKQLLLLTKTLLVATVLLMGGATSAWAEQVKVTLYSQNYNTGTENNEVLGDWSAFSNSSTNWDESGKFAKLNATSQSSRGFLYSSFGISDDSFTDITTYYVEFDFGYYNSSTSTNNQTSQLVVTTTKLTSPTDFGSHNTSYTGNERLFSLHTTTSSKNQDPSTFYVNQTSETGENTFEAARPTECTHHVKLTVNRSARTVAAVITKLSDSSTAASDTYNLEDGVDTKITGIWVALGAYWSRLFMDNIDVYYYATKLAAPTITPSYWGYAYTFTSTQEVGTPAIQYDYTYTPTVGDVVNGTATSYAPTTPGTLSVVTSLVTPSNLYVSSDATETTSVNPYVKVATFDFTSKDASNKSGTKKTNDTYFGFTQNAKNIRFQHSYNSKASNFFNGLTVNCETNSQYFNIVDGYGMYNQSSSADGTITYNHFNGDEDLVTELVYRTGDAENTAVWASTPDEYRYGAYSSGYGVSMKQNASTYEVYKTLNVYAPLSTAKVQATIGEAGVATFCAPCPLDFSGVEGLTAYTATVDGSVVKLTQVNNVPANTGVVLMGEAGTYTIPAVASSETAKGDLTGINVRTVPAAAGTGKSNYVLSKENDVVGFYVLPNNGAVQACRAYLVAPTVGGEARGMRIVLADDITGISEAKAEAAAEKEGKFIVEGKLVIFKNGKKFNANGTEIK